VVLYKRVDAFTEQYSELSHICEEEFKNKKRVGIDGDGEKKIKLHEFTYYRDGKKISDAIYIAFLRKIFDHRTEEYYDWAFATNLKEVNLDEIVGKYKIIWKIENIFRVQDEATIKSKSLNINVRYFLFAY
jgi:hypothetical protein